MPRKKFSLSDIRNKVPATRQGFNYHDPFCGSCAVKINVDCSAFPMPGISKLWTRMRVRDLQSTGNRCAGLQIRNDGPADCCRSAAFLRNRLGAATTSSRIVRQQLLRDSCRPVLKNPPARQAQIATSMNHRFQFHDRRQLLICVHDKSLTAAMRGSNSDC